MYGRTTSEKAAYWIFGDRIPVTKLLIAANVITFFAVGLSVYARTNLPSLLEFSPASALIQPWAAFTYPLLGLSGSPIYLLCAGYWLWIAGGSLERSLGSIRFAIYFFGMSAISAAGLFIGYKLTGISIAISSLWLPLAGITMAFAMMNPEQQILFFFIIPMKLKYLALLDVVIVLVSFGGHSILIGILALSGCAFSYWYATRGFSYGHPSRADKSEVIHIYKQRRLFGKLNLLRLLQERREKKRLKKFFDKSGFDD